MAYDQLEWRVGSVDDMDDYISVFIAKLVPRLDGEFDVDVEMIPTSRRMELIESSASFVWAPVPYSLERSFDKAADLLFSSVLAVA